MKMNKFACALAIVGLLCTVTFAEPPTAKFDTDNLSGGDPIMNGKLQFKPGLDLTVVEIGNYDIKLSGLPKLKKAGVYYYYPMLDLVLFSGVKTGDPLPPGGVVTAAGTIKDGEVVSGSGVVSIGEDIDGVHVLKPKGSGGEG